MQPTRLRLVSLAALALTILLPLTAAASNPLLRATATQTARPLRPLLNALPIDTDEAAAALATSNTDTAAAVDKAVAETLPTHDAQETQAAVDKPALAVLLANANTNTVNKATSAAAAAAAAGAQPITRSTDADIDPDALRNLKPFPPADPGMKRFVLFMPRSNTSSSDLMVEIQVGRTLLLEPRNLYSFASSLQTHTLQGWGFSYYSLPAWGPMTSTRMAVDPEQPKVQRWVQTRASPLMCYNTRLPIVVYAPADAEVRMRYWQAEAQTRPVTEA